MKESVEKKALVIFGQNQTPVSLFNVMTIQIEKFFCQS